MAPHTLSDILDDLRAADRALYQFEQRYWPCLTSCKALRQAEVDNGEQDHHPR